MPFGFDKISDPFGFLPRQGKLAPNLLLGSQDLANAAWIRVNVGAPAVNAANAPDGTLTADRITRGSTAAAWIQQSVAKAAQALPFRMAGFAQKHTGNYLAARIQGTYPARADVTFNLNTGAIHVAATASGAFSNAKAQLIPFGGGWYYFELSAVSDAAATIIAMASFNSGGGAIDNVDTAANSAGYLWDVTLRQM